MRTLAIDASAAAGSVAVCETGAEKKVLASFYQNVALTHSETLAPMIEDVMRMAGLSLGELDQFAVNVGPGSFTGLRIALSVVKGMAFALSKPVVPVSTLYSLAYNLVGQDCIACAVMDARREQVYNGIFRISGSEIERLTDDRPIAISELLEQLGSYENVILVGDGAEQVAAKSGGQLVVAPPHLRYQNAVSTAFAAKIAVNLNELNPVYLRLTQAERERLGKIEQDNIGETI